jgi:hypothetical protein
MAEQFWRLLVRISALLRVIPARARGTAYKPATLPRSSSCQYFDIMLDAPLLLQLTKLSRSPSFRTDKAVLAVNGFAADGNMFVKKVRQRLEVCIATCCVSFTSDNPSYRCTISGTDMPMQRTCLSGLLLASSKPCSTRVASSHTMSTTFLAALKKMVCSICPLFRMHKRDRVVVRTHIGTSHA